MERYAMMVATIWFLGGSVATGIVGVLLVMYGAWFYGALVIGSGFASAVLGIAMMHVWLLDGFRSLFEKDEEADE